MDQLVELLQECMRVYTERNMRSDEGRQMDAAGKMPAVQGGGSGEKMETREEMPSNRRFDEGLRFLAAEKGPAVQGEDSEEKMEMPSKRISDEGLQVHAAGQRPEVQGADADEVKAVMRSEMLQVLMQSMQPGYHKEMLAKLLKYEEENQRQKQENQRQKEKVLQNLMQSMPPSDQKELLAKLLKYEEGKQPQKQENQQQKQENQHQKQKKKHHRKSRMALRKVEMDKVKKSNLEKAPPREDKAAAYLAAWAKERESEPESKSHSDRHAYQARLCHDRWNQFYAAGGHYGTYETITSIPSMRFTDYVDPSAGPRETLQIFSVKVVRVKEGIDWPLCVYGKLAVRDTVDRNRNIIFDRQRDNFQTVTKQDPYLILTGPSRAAVLSVRHSYIEAELKIKGNSNDDSDDKDFSYLAAGYIQTGPCQSFIMQRVLSSRLSTLELTVGHIVNSVEATISMEVSSGKWPSGYGGVCMVSTASMEDMEIVLLSFGDDGLPLEDDGKKIRLSRRVVSVEVDGRLNVAVKALLPGGSSKSMLSDERFFTPKEAGRNQLTMKVGSCEMEITVAWSLLLTYNH